MNRTHLLGIFASAAQTTQAIIALRRAGFDVLDAHGPVPDPAVDQARGAGVSPVRRYTLAGGLVGCASGFALTIWTALQWNLIVSGKPVVALVPFVVIAFELTILFGALATVLGVFIHARLPRLGATPGYDTRFSGDRFGLLVRCPPERAAAAEAGLRQAGAEEIRRLEEAAEWKTHNGKFKTGQ